MLYLLYKIGVLLALGLPVKLSYWIADIAGSLYYLLAKKDKQIVINNNKVVLNQGRDSQRLYYTSRMVFVNFARYLIDFFRTSKLNSEYIERHIRIEGKHNLDQALSLGRGALLVSAHLGNWEWGAMTLSMLGYKVSIMVWTHKNKLVNNFFLQQRQSKGLTVIPLGLGIRKIFSALKNNEIVALLADVDYLQPNRGVEVKLFGRQTIMPKGPAVISLKTSSPIVPCFLLREKGGNFKFVFEKPIIYQASEDNAVDLAAFTQEITKVIESYIAAYPEQWFMLTMRWQNNL